MRKVYVGDVYESRCAGSYVVLDLLPGYRAIIQFLNTGFLTNVVTGRVAHGNIKDPMNRSVNGVGFLGVGKYKVTENGRETNRYRVWSNMIERCYSKSFHKKNKTYIGCTVCDDWHNFQIFGAWYDQNYSEGMFLDKDIIKEGNKIYSPEFCKFVTRLENNQKARAKNYRLLSPEGNIIDIYNLKRFCEENSLSYNCLSKVHKGLRLSHKGWMKA